MKKILLTAIFASICLQYTLAQCPIRISLLTCAPGDELYSTFGHTAVRVQDSSTGNDLVFNYGTFEFSPEFYVKFVRGKLLYYLSVEKMENFRWQYQYESRSIIEQEVNLSCPEKEKLYAALQWNARDENKYYRYDFLFDNCTTRAGDMIIANASDSVRFENILEADRPSFRDLIHTYLDSGHQYWSKVGIDLLLGAKLDRKVNNREAMFLPDYLMKGFDHARSGGKPFMASKQTILEMPSPLSGPTVFTPLFFFSILFLLVLIASFSNWQQIATALRIFDLVFFLFLGLVGCLLIFMWWGTDHRVTQNNYNMLWALPSHVAIFFLLLKQSRLVPIYFRIVWYLNMLMLLGWFWLPQEMNAAFLPILLISAVRSWRLSTLYGIEKN